MDIARGLLFLHANHVMHRDVKSANVLLNTGSIKAKLSDFGTCVFLFWIPFSSPIVASFLVSFNYLGTVARMATRGSMVGTYMYMAPEVRSCVECFFQ